MCETRLGDLLAELIGFGCDGCSVLSGCDVVCCCFLLSISSLVLVSMLCIGNK